MAWEDDSIVGQIASKVGLPTPVPDRWDTVPDELLEQYILGYGRVLDDPEIEGARQASIVGAINEHIRARHKDYFDIVADYFQRANKYGASQLFFTLERMCGSSVAMADKMLEVYSTDYRWFKDYFQVYFAKRGVQRHWDAMANDATTKEDIELLTMLANSKKRQLDQHGVNPWIPELPANNPE